ncbi:membrane primary amine oxidase-like [Empidonax traillii]|nr:membrane primary amine oxidase-like [Empidonax traillii]
MNPKLPYVLLVGAAVIIFILSCMLLSRGRGSPSCESQPSTVEEKTGSVSQSLVFADLTPEEMAQVVRYLQGNLGVPLVDASRAKPSDNCIASVDLQVPAKAEVLRFLDGGGARPAREALAVLYFGNQPDPNVTEYVVGPLPVPAYHRDVTVRKYGGKVLYHRRPTLGSEYKQVGAFLEMVAFAAAPSFLQEVLEYDSTNVAFQATAPHGFQSGDRKSWFILFQNVSGFFLHPVGLEVLVDHSSLDISRWAVSRVFYNGQYYRDMVQLESAYVQGRISVEKVRKAPRDGDFSSMKPRAPSAALFPLQYEPQGPRYSVRNNLVHFQAWSFAFGMSVSTGLRLFDIRHKGERVAYEISVQEALSVYGSNCPGGMSTRYMDGSFGLGRYTSPLVRGVDCPYSATYVDTHALSETLRPSTRKASLCIFEQNLGSPLRRHYSNLQSLYYGGLVNSALVVRSIATVGNYDYVWDFIFYQNGAIEGKVQATGYPSSSFLHGDGLRYGNRLWEHTLGMIRTHAINYKVDLDVGGLKNSLVAHDMAFEMTRAPWSPEQQIERPRLTKKVLDTEDQAAFRLQSKMPRYIYFAANSKNKWGHQRGYRIQITSFAGDHIPEASSMERAISWARYQLAVTRRKEEEPTSTSIYNQNDPWTPTVAFANFINNETITNEDLVAWITTGFLHIPHSEDIPNTVTDGQSLVFADLTPEEMAQVVRYLQGNLGVPLVDASRAKPSDNCIASVDLQVPAKAEVLRFLDGGGARPAREALAVLYFGNQPDPNVTEYVVGPLPAPAYHRDVTVRKYGGKVPYHRRPVTGKEYVDINALIQRELKKAPRFLAACCESDGTDLAVLTTAPRGFKSGDRTTWFVLFHNVAGTGYYLSPVGLEVLVEHGDLHISRWQLRKVFYNGRYFASTEDLEREFLARTLEVVRLKKPQADAVLGSMRPRHLPDSLGPLQFEPQGPRYNVRDNHITYQGWSITFGMNPNSGPRLFDIRYRGERIVYELSLQEALALYGSNCPGGMSTRYLDGSFGIGRFAYELVQGLDCPYMATYVDRHYLAESDTPKTNQKSLCIFEHDSALPLRRHFSDSQSFYYGGLRKNTLVIRTISTLINYDYIWDFMFHGSGAVEVRVHATGYISTSFLHGQGTDYGNRVGPHTLGTMHLHHMHYKVDLDVDGRSGHLCSWLQFTAALPGVR